jgi:hypothetical protein
MLPPQAFRTVFFLAAPLAAGQVRSQDAPRSSPRAS